MTSVKDLVRKPVKALLGALRWQKSALVNAGKPVPIFATMAAAVPKGLRVHLGAGEINLQGWVNIDARDFGHIHSQTTSLDLHEFADGAVSIIYTCHVLEHLSFDAASALLRALHKKLADGGMILIAVPDFDAIVRIYRASGGDLDTVKHPLMGGQGYEYNFHKSVYNHRALERLLQECGYRDVMPWQTESEFGCALGDWSSATVKMADGDTVALSLNLKATKFAGRS